MNILLVEPDKVLGGMLAQDLKAAGHNVLWRRSAQTALDALDEQLPDLIILEIQLGLHNGIEFLYEIRSYPEWRSLSVIVHTLNPRVQETQFNKAFKQLGVGTVLYKPTVTSQQLLRAVTAAPAQL